MDLGIQRESHSITGPHLYKVESGFPPSSHSSLTINPRRGKKQNLDGKKGCSFICLSLALLDLDLFIKQIVYDHLLYTYTRVLGYLRYTCLLKEPQQWKTKTNKETLSLLYLQLSGRRWTIIINIRNQQIIGYIECEKVIKYYRKTAEQGKAEQERGWEVDCSFT